MSKWIDANSPPIRSESFLTVIMYRPEGFKFGHYTYPAYPGYFHPYKREWHFLHTQGSNIDDPVLGVTHYQHLSSLLWHNEGWSPGER